MTESMCAFVDGKPVASSSGEILELLNPANGQKSLIIPAGTPEDANNAVSAARRAFDDGRWCHLSPFQRRSILYKFADLVEAEIDELDRMDAQDMGKPISLSWANAAAAPFLLRYCADAIEHVIGDHYGSPQDNLVVQARLPRGVVSAIVPWNFPTTNAAIKIAPALAAGNCVVLKPSECSPSSAMRLVQIAMEAGIPSGVLNLLPGSGDTVGRALALHNDVDMITFTGSTSVGKLMLQYSGQSNMKVVNAECGGKSPQIVFPDFEDIDMVADYISQMILRNQGQVCIAGSRLLVHKDIEKALVEKIAERFSQVKMGDPLDPDVTFGPLVNNQQKDKVLSYINSGKCNGAILTAGGNATLLDTGGYFIEPTLFTQVSPKSPLAQEEIFGPVLSVTSFSDVDEALNLANATRFGLAATVWTKNVTASMQLAKSIRAGIVTVNATRPNDEGPLAKSIEPCGYSGIGAEGGQAGLESYLRRQVMWFNHG